MDKATNKNIKIRFLHIIPIVASLILPVLYFCTIHYVYSPYHGGKYYSVVNGITGTGGVTIALFSILLFICAIVFGCLNIFLYNNKKIKIIGYFIYAFAAIFCILTFVLAFSSNSFLPK